MREKLSVMSDRNFPSTLIEMKKLAAESTRFRNEELPPRHRDKQHLVHLYKELQVRIEFVLFIVTRQLKNINRFYLEIFRDCW